MNTLFDQILGFAIGIIGEAMVTRFIAKVQLWWDVKISNDMKTKTALEYDRMFKEAKDLTKLDPPQ